MTKYKNYYIDGVYFNSKADIDAFVLEQAIEAHKKAVIMFTNNCSIECSIFCEEKAQALNNLGLGWDEIEALEIEAMKAA